MSTEDIEKKEEWRERFRKEFVCGHPGDSGPGGNTPSEPESWIEAYPHEVEDFIYAERQNARAEALGEVEKMMYEKESLSPCPYCGVYSPAPCECFDAIRKYRNKLRARLHSLTNPHSPQS